MPPAKVRCSKLDEKIKELRTRYMPNDVAKILNISRGTVNTVCSGMPKKLLKKEIKLSKGIYNEYKPELWTKLTTSKLV